MEFEFLIPITALLIPIVAILTYHQRKMAEIVHRHGATPQVMGEVERLRQEVAHMRMLLNEQTIAVDNALNALRIPGAETNVKQY
ncbi:MAG: hypothetical protein IT363_02415 [Methanoregulaceae archaeon]|jgi:hypothetical protein|nr:hypothetical protein [Methanoregulaceae archaeon]